MNMRLLWSCLTASSVLLISGVAFSGGAKTPIEMMDFDRATAQLWAYPEGKPLTVFVHSPQTQHLVANLERFTPPDPCRAYAQFWNFTVAFDNKHRTDSTFVYEILLGGMSASRCSAVVTSTPAGALTSIGPSAK